MKRKLVTAAVVAILAFFTSFIGVFGSFDVAVYESYQEFVGAAVCYPTENGKN